MNSQQLLFINIVLGVVFLLYFGFGRNQPKAPTRLNLKNKDTPNSPKLQQSQPQLASKMTVLEPENESLKKEFSSTSQPRNLAIFFIYNGHDWEAYSVLGVAQGANMKVVTESYQKLLETSDSKSFEFLEAAFKTILSKKRRDVL